MNQSHIKAILEGVIPELKGAIASAQRPLMDRIEEIEKREPAVAEKGEPGRDGKDAEPVELSQVVEALQSFDMGQLLKDALSGEHNIDVVAPDDVAKEMAAAISILAEPIVKKELPITQQQRPRKLTFERDEQNRIVSAVEE